jgi:hypothetical protein
MLFGSKTIVASLSGAIFGRIGRHFRDLVGDRMRNLLDFRRPVLFLRAHGDDGLLIDMDAAYFGRSDRTAFHWSREESIPLEEILASRLQRYGPLVALRTSYQAEERFQFRRYLVDESLWHHQILYWIRRASLIVILVGPERTLSDPRFGLAWEISTILAMNCPHKVLVVLPPLEKKELQRRWRAYQRLVNDQCGGTGHFPDGDEMPRFFVSCTPGWKHHFEGPAEMLASTYDRAIKSVIKDRHAYRRPLFWSVLILILVVGLLLMRRLL